MNSIYTWLYQYPLHKFTPEFVTVDEIGLGNVYDPTANVACNPLSAPPAIGVGDIILFVVPSIDTELDTIIPIQNVPEFAGVYVLERDTLIFDSPDCSDTAEELFTKYPRDEYNPIKKVPELLPFVKYRVKPVTVWSAVSEMAFKYNVLELIDTPLVNESQGLVHPLNG